MDSFVISERTIKLRHQIKEVMEGKKEVKCKDKIISFLNSLLIQEELDSNPPSNKEKDK